MIRHSPEREHVSGAVNLPGGAEVAMTVRVSWVLTGESTAADHVRVSPPFPKPSSFMEQNFSSKGMSLGS